MSHLFTHKGPILLHPFPDPWKSGARSCHETRSNAILRPHQGSESRVPLVRWQKPRGVIQSLALCPLARWPWGKPCSSLSLVVPIENFLISNPFSLLDSSPVSSTSPLPFSLGPVTQPQPGLNTSCVPRSMWEARWIEMAIDRHTCGCVGTHRWPRHSSTRHTLFAIPHAQPMLSELERPQTLIWGKQPVTDTPSPMASRTEGGKVLRGSSEGFLQGGILVMSF